MKIFAAGSLKRAFNAWLKDIQPHFSELIAMEFGPAGLLRERIEQGEQADLFASANAEHPEALSRQYAFYQCCPFIGNRLCVIGKTEIVKNRPWLELLAAPEINVGTSTPLSDPGGDYAQQLFDRIEQFHPTLGNQIRSRAKALVGGKNAIAIPQGETPSIWLIRQGLADLFISYASNALTVKNQPDLSLLAIPPAYQPDIRYGLISFNPECRPLVESLCSGRGQQCLLEHGFQRLNM